MADFLVNLAQRKSARKLIKFLGLPVPLPQKLRRTAEPWQNEPLSGRSFIVASGKGGDLGPRIVKILEAAGATAYTEGSGPTSVPVQGLLLDASGLADPRDLRALYDFFSPRLTELDRNGRIVVVARPPDSLDGAAAAAAAALDGFVRSIAKEIGGRGATANLFYVQSGADARLEGPLRFILSDRAAYISGQPLQISKTVKGSVEGRWSAPLQDEVILITGAARGIGAESARALAAEGAHVICLDRPEESELLEGVATDIGGSTLAVDLLDDDAPERIVAQLTERHGAIDVVVHNAGITRDKTLAKMRPESWDQTLGVNLGVVTRLTPPLLDSCLQEGGRIICMSSIAGIAGNFGQTNYSASKAGLIGYVRAMAPSLGKRGISINAIAPGYIETRLTEAIPMMTREVARRMNALSQGGLPEDVAQAVTFLASPDSIGITGVVLRVCGLSLVGA